MESLTTVERALDVLHHLHAAPDACGVSEIGRSLGIGKSTVHRLLSALSARGFVEREPGGRYRPGMALVALGVGALEREPAVAAARPCLERLTRELGDTLFLAAARAGRLWVLDKEEGSGFLRASPRVGAEVPLHATAVGKLHLAFAPERVEQPAKRLERFTPRTRTSLRQLARELERVRAQGFATNREEWIPELCGVAAPVMRSGRLVAALALAGPTSRVDPTPGGAAVRAVQRGAAEIAARLDGMQT